MKRFTQLLCLFCLTLFVLFACKKDGSAGYTPPPAGPTDETITASVQGRIVDENGTPVNGAAISVGNATGVTDINGSFSFSNIKISKYFGKITISKNGYFTVTKTIVTSTSGTSFISAELLTRRLKGSFSASSGASVQIDNGVNVNFQPNSLVTVSTNAVYSGTVNVFASYLDPTDAKMGVRMPGDLRGIDSSGKSVGLETFGMMVVELEGSGGEKLQIANGETAVISAPIPVSLQSKAPATIPMWYFNDSTGQWSQQGNAVNQGGVYVGSVSHFSYWNYDVSVPIIYFNGFIKDAGGNPIANMSIAITNQATNETRIAYSASDGSIYGGLISNTVNTLKVLNKCGDELGSKDIGPFTANTDLGIITVPLSPGNTLTITGTAVDCSNAPVASGFAEITIEGFKYLSPITAGAFSITVDRCNSTGDSAFLVVGDYGSLAVSPVQSFYVTTGNSNVGEVSVCGGNFSQFISFSIGNSSYAITVPSDSIAINHPAYLYAFGGNYNTASYKYLDLYPFNIDAPGVYDGITLRITLGTTNYFILAAEPVQLTITQYGAAVGQDIIGTFTGNMYTDTLNLVTKVPITGSIKLLRSY